MNYFDIILYLGLIGAARCFTFQNIQAGAEVDNTARLEQFINIGTGAQIKRNVNVRGFASIGPFCSIGEGADIGSYAKIGENTFIGNAVSIGQFSMIGGRNTIAPGSVVLDYVRTGNFVTIGNRAQVNQYSNIANNAEIGDDCILDDYSKIGSNVKVHQKAYVGMFSSVHQNTVIDESAVIHKFVEIPPNVHVQRNLVVIRSPTSYELYTNCIPSGSISESQVAIAANQNNGAVSPEFNNLMLRLIDGQINEMTTACAQTNIPRRPENLPQIISLYLIQYHGLTRFNKNLQHVQNGMGSMSNQVYINGVRMNCSPSMSAIQQLQNEYHFVASASRNILTGEVSKKFIQLLAMAQDGERERRVANDTVCSMIAQIRNGGREVTCANRSDSAPSNNC